MGLWRAVNVSQTAAEFRERALECFQWAQQAVGLRRKKPWLVMAQLWLDRAESAERDDRRNDVPDDQAQTRAVPGDDGADAPARTR